MIINVAQFLKYDVGTVRHVTIDETMPPLTGQIELTAPVHGDVELIRTNRGILARADLPPPRVSNESVSRGIRRAASDQLFGGISPVVDVGPGLPRTSLTKVTPI